MGTNQHLRAKLIMKYLSRFRELCNDLLDNGYLPVFAKEEALNTITKEYLEENPDVEPEITCQVFFVIGDLSHNLKLEGNKYKERFKVMEELFREEKIKIDEDKVIKSNPNKSKYL